MASTLTTPLADSRETYRVGVGEGAPEASQVLRVVIISVRHVPLLDFLLLHLSEWSLLVHPATELVRTLSLRPTS